MKKICAILFLLGSIALSNTMVGCTSVPKYNPNSVVFQKLPNLNEDGQTVEVWEFKEKDVDFEVVFQNYSLGKPIKFANEESNILYAKLQTLESDKTYGVSITDPEFLNYLSSSDPDLQLVLKLQKNNTIFVWSRNQISELGFMDFGGVITGGKLVEVVYFINDKQAARNWSNVGKLIKGKF